MLMAVPAAYAANAGVNIIYPPKRVADFDKADPAPQAAKTVVELKIKVRHDFLREYMERRRFWVERALFQNYTGFQKSYSGRKYPF